MNDQNPKPPALSLRDYFAAHILASGVIDKELGLPIEEAADELGIPVSEYTWSIHWPILRAKRVYEAADAMVNYSKQKPR